MFFDPLPVSETAETGREQPMPCRPAGPQRSEPWALIPSAPYQWILMAEHALEQGDQDRAEELIEMAYWSADGLEQVQLSADENS
jgi:hypothetical protein